MSSTPKKPSAAAETRAARAAARANKVAMDAAAAAAAEQQANAAAAAAAAVAAAPAGAPGAANAPAPDANALMLQMLQQSAAANAALVAEQQQQRLERAEQAAAARQLQLVQNAGPPPRFHGEVDSMKAWTWLESMKKFFEQAELDEDDDEERMKIVAGALKDGAWAWFAAARAAEERASAANEAVPLSINKWRDFVKLLTKHYLPVNAEQHAWSRLGALSKGNNSNVTDYTEKFNALCALTNQGADSDTPKLVMYRAGLPSYYLEKCISNNYATLQTAMEAMLLLYNSKHAARSAANEEHKHREDKHRDDKHRHKNHAQHNHTEADTDDSDDERDHAASSSGGSSSAARIAKLEAQLSAMVAASSSNAHNRGGGRGGRGGGARGGRGGGTFPSEGYKRGDGERLNIPEDVAKKRLRANACMKCGEKGHYKNECKNALNTKDVPLN